MDKKTISYKLYNIAINSADSIITLLNAYKAACLVNILLCINLIYLNYVYRRTDYIAQIAILLVSILTIFNLIRIRKIRKTAKILENSIVETKELGTNLDDL